jgi:hypothetical protein
MQFIGILFFALPTFLGLSLIAIILKYVLQFLFKILHVPNFSTAFPSGFLSWRKLAPPDILFRLAFLAALNLLLYWVPIYYWSTYEDSDDRSGFVLMYALAFCPVSWILAVLCYIQACRSHSSLSARSRPAFFIVSSLLLLIVLSTVIPQMKLHLRYFEVMHSFHSRSLDG